MDKRKIDKEQYPWDSDKVKKMASNLTVKDIMQKDVKTAENNTVV